MNFDKKINSFLIEDDKISVLKKLKKKFDNLFKELDKVSDPEIDKAELDFIATLNDRIENGY